MTILSKMSLLRGCAKLPTPVIAQWGRFNSTAAPAAAFDEADPEWETAQPYSKIPGPKPLPIPSFGNFWRMLPFGTFGGLSMIELHGKLNRDYGEIVKFAGFGRPDMVCVYDPDDVEKVFRNESIWPKRTPLDSIDYYRRVTRVDVYQGNPGVLSSQGEEWQKNRTAVNQPMMRPKNVLQYHQPIQTVASEFLQRIRALRDDKLEMPKDFANELNKWALESISLVALDARLGCLDGDLAADSDAQIMIDSVDQMFHLIFQLDMMPSLWKFYSTSDWKKFVKTTDNITSISMKHINRKIEAIKARPSDDPQGQSVLETLLRSPGGQPIAVTMAMDMMMAGIDTTSNTTAIALYYLAKNPQVQEKAFEEVKKLLPTPDADLPPNYLNDIPYLKACIKESQRLSPLALGNARAAGKDLVIKGYRIPKGTDIIMSNMIMCHMEKHFPRPEEYIPERWLKSEKDSDLSASKANPFVFLPFGFGPRMCIGRRMAEMEMHTILSKIIRNFKLAYNYGEMEWTSEMLISPKKPLQFRMEDRRD